VPAVVLAEADVAADHRLVDRGIVARAEAGFAEIASR